MAPALGAYFKKARRWLRPLAAASIVAGFAAAPAPVAAEGFVPAGQLGPTVYVTVLIQPDFPFYAQLCPSGSDRRPVVFGFAAENSRFSQTATLAAGGSQTLGLAIFACGAGASAPNIRVPSPIETGRLIDSGILSGWRWISGGAYGALFSKTIVSGGRKVSTACIEQQPLNKCLPVTGAGTCPYAVTANSALLDGLESLLRAQIGSGNVDYAWRVDYGQFSATSKPSSAPSNDPSKMALFVRSNAVVRCSLAEELPPDAVTLLDQSSIVFVTDGTCSYRSGTGRIIYYAC